MDYKTMIESRMTDAEREDFIEDCNRAIPMFGGRRSRQSTLILFKHLKRAAASSGRRLRLTHLNFIRYQAARRRDEFTYEEWDKLVRFFRWVEQYETGRIPWGAEHWNILLMAWEAELGIQWEG